MNYCKCGCKKIVFSPDKRGRERFFCKGHRLLGLKRKPMSQETKEKIGMAHLGKKMSSSFRQKCRERMLGHTPWNKGKKTGFAPWRGKKRPGLSALRKRQWAEGERIGGWTLTQEQKDKISARQKGDKSHFWKGGKTPVNERERKRRETKVWRCAVFERDNWTCQICGKRGCKLQADHIKRFSDYPELRFELSNGRTLCIDCHKKTNTYGNKKQQKEGILTCL